MRRALIAIAALALVGCTTAPPAPKETQQTMDYDVSQIRQVESQTIPLGGAVYTVTRYENDAYSCGTGDASYPFVVVEQQGSEQRPLWVMLHGGGTGWYDDSQTYVGDESYNRAESTATLLTTVGMYLIGDTAIGERVRAGDRVVLGSLCDHDLYLGLGQPYPNNPAGGTVDGLLANLAMLDYVQNARPTSSVFALGQSAGSYGAWALAHERWSRGLPIDGVVLDSGLLGARSFDLFHAGVGTEFYAFDEKQMAEKHGRYFTDSTLHAENAVAAGFDVPMFVADAMNDPGCGGASDPITGVPNCDYLYQPLAETLTAPHQQLHLYPGGGHIVTASPGSVQTDLRAWLAALPG